MAEADYVPVPTAIASYKDKSVTGVDIPWAVTELVEGNAIGSGSGANTGPTGIESMVRQMVPRI